MIVRIICNIVGRTVFFNRNIEFFLRDSQST